MALQESTERRLTILRDLPDIVYEVDPRGYLIFINDAVRTLGYEPRELIGKHFGEIVHPDDVALITRNSVLPKYRGKTTGAQRAPKLFDERRTGRRTTKNLEIRLIPKRTKEKDDVEEMIGRLVVFADVSSAGRYRVRAKKKGRDFLGSLGIIRDVTAHKQAEAKLRKLFEAMISTLAATVEISDSYTAGHQERVANLAYNVAKEMKLSHDQTMATYFAAVIHDIGKISIPAEILNKPSGLTEAEFSIVKTHPRVGYDILKKIEFPWPIAEIVLEHHERMDGSGYPQGLASDQIRIEARILGLVDVIDAVCSYRPYRPARDLESALRIISQSKHAYDPEAVEACLRLFREKGLKLRDLDFGGDIIFQRID